MNTEKNSIFSQSARPRWLHPVAWWTWALFLAAAASQTTNPLFLGLLIGAAAIVVAKRKPDAPWGKSFEFFLALGAMIIVIRVLFQVIFGASLGSTVLVTLPGVSLPEQFSGLRLGGDITLESLLGAFYDGLRLATIAIVIGAANSLASPARLLKALPSALYELGVSVVVALSFIPQLVTDGTRIREMRRLRGRPTKGLRAIAGLALPVLAGALDRSINLAASMDSRGYGRINSHSPTTRRFVVALLLLSTVLILIGTFGLFTAESNPLLGLPTLAVGVSLALISLWKSGNDRVRTVYRPDRWTISETLVSAAGLSVFLLIAGADFLFDQYSVLHPTLNQWPQLPWWGILAFVIACTPAVSSPVPPKTMTVDVNTLAGVTP